MTGIPLAGRSYKVMVRVNSENGFNGNALRFPTRDRARVYGLNLAARWGAIEDWRIDPSDDPVTEYPPDAVETAGES